MVEVLYLCIVRSYVWLSRRKEIEFERKSGGEFGEKEAQVTTPEPQKVAMW